MKNYNILKCFLYAYDLKQMRGFMTNQYKITKHSAISTSPTEAEYSTNYFISFQMSKKMHVFVFYMCQSFAKVQFVHW